MINNIKIYNIIKNTRLLTNDKLPPILYLNIQIHY